MSDLICIGALSGAFGVRGDVRLKSFTAEPSDVAAYGEVTSEDGSRSFTITLTGQTTNGALIARLSGVDTREQADALRGVRLFVPRDRLPALEEGEFYHSDLIGLEVFDTGGRRLGQVRSVFNHGAADLLEVQGPDLPSTVLLPFTLTTVPTVDLAAGRLVADPPDGLFPDLPA